MVDFAFNTLNYVMIWFDDSLWALIYVYENFGWDIFYELYDELRFHDMFEKSMNNIWY
jgi:hypothetical protein